MPLRPAHEGDLATVVELIQALADYERQPEAVELDPATLRQHLFGPRPYAEVLLAETEDGHSAGFALYFHNFSTWKGRPGVYLEDLFVRPEHRGRGFGRALLTALAHIACERGCARLEWSVLDWNEQAIGFYRALGAEPLDEWTTFRLSGHALEGLAAGGRSPGAAAPAAARLTSPSSAHAAAGKHRPEP
ncbi:MAG: GNAT family N-acetyltransferase [Dehalococcoidia bacterium]|nr:GNAT family N-acetyltransferase [Dehalococcoidia bacterium]